MRTSQVHVLDRRVNRKAWRPTFAALALVVLMLGASSTAGSNLRSHQGAAPSRSATPDSSRRARLSGFELTPSTHPEYGEPSLRDAARRDPILRVYRFVWLRSFDPPIVLRLLVGADGAGTLIVKQAGKADAQGRWSYVQETAVDISREHVVAFLRALNTQEFWAEQDSVYEQGGADGAAWILEGVEKGQYRIQVEWSPERSALRNAALILLSYSGLNAGPVY